MVYLSGIISGMRRRCRGNEWSLLLLLSVLQFVASEKKLRLVHIAWRHGDRSPSASFPTDTENPESSWPQGWGELTQTGMQQHYNLGTFIRDLYKEDFLPARYSKYEVYVRSTDYNRTLMSAMANLAALFPPEGGQVWNTKLPWQPVPIHSRPREEDPMLWMEYPCPVETDLYDEVMKSPEVQRIMAENKDLFDLLRNKTGLCDKELDTLDDIWKVFDPLNCEKQHQNDTSHPHPWPSWVTNELFERISKLHDMSTTFYYKTPKIQRLRGGLLLSDILNRMKSVTENPSRLKLYIYSSHDTTLTALLTILGAYNNRIPPYAAAVFLELYQDGDKHFIELHYKNGTGEPHHLEIGGCPEPCTLDAFEERSKPLIPTNYRLECGLDGLEDQISKQHWIMVFSFLACTLVALLITCIFLILKLRRVPAGGIQYKPLPIDDSSINRNG